MSPAAERWYPALRELILKAKDISDAERKLATAFTWIEDPCLRRELFHECDLMLIKCSPVGEIRPVDFDVNWPPKDLAL